MRIKNVIICTVFTLIRHGGTEIHKQRTDRKKSDKDQFRCTLVLAL